MSENKYIRFINSDYKTLFHLPDGGRIRVTYADGEQAERVCRFVDECHTEIGNNIYHICEFAERMERIGAKYQPLDYIREPEFYPKFCLTVIAGIETPPGVSPPVYYIIDETERYGFGFAPKGAKGQRYCVFEKLPDAYNRCRIGKILQWSGRLYEISPREWGFDPAKIKAVTQRPKKHPDPKQSYSPKMKRSK